MGCSNQVAQGGVCRRHGAKKKQKLCNYFGGMCTNIAVRGGVCKRHGANDYVSDGANNKKRKASNTNDAAAIEEETEETQPSPSEGKEDSKQGGEHFEKFLSTIK